MSLPDLLQWLAASAKTGTLRVERNRATKVLRMRDGRVTGSSSDEPSLRLGQFLLSQKKITEEQLRQALATKEKTSGFIGETLVGAGALDADELREALQAKAQEVIYSLFDWPDGVFRFEETIDEKDVFPVEIRVEELLLCGLQRHDEMAAIRRVLHDPGIVLRYTSKPPGSEIFSNETRRLMYSSIDGERTLSEILLHVHGTEYQVKKFLYDLHEKGYVELVGIKHSKAGEDASTEDVPAVDNDDLDLPPLENLDLDFIPELRESDTDQTSAVAATAGASVATASSTIEMGQAPAPSLAAELSRAGELMTGGDLENALDVLDALYRENPGDDALRRLTAEAEAAFVDQAYRDTLPDDHVPVLTRPVEELAAETLTPQECFVLSRIDGNWDIKSIVQVAPFREIEALRTLKRMREMGIIQLEKPDGSRAT
jgi:hypothetical protein